MMSPDARKPTLPRRSRRPLFVLPFTLALTALLCAVTAPYAHAQDDHQPTDDWADDGGTVLVSVDAMNAATRPTLTIREGESGTYWMKLSDKPPDEAASDDPWWVFVHVDGQRHGGGEYESIGWTPSIGREFHTGNWNQWLSIRIDAKEDGDEENETYTFTHELWDHDAYCPPSLHGIAAVTVRVIDDDGPNAPKPELSIGDASVEEGGTARFTVRLDTESENPVTVRYRTSNGTARAGSDYDAADDTLTIPAGMQSGVIEVQTTEDDDYEADESFTVRLSSPVGATIGDGTGDGTIEDDDDEPGLSIADVTVEEGRTAEFEVTLDASSHAPVTVHYATMDGNATDGSDYTATNGTLTFSPGTETRTIRVSTREDQAKEPATETFTVELSQAEGATIDDGIGIGSITDDDQAALPSLRIEDTTVDEGDTASFTVKLSVQSDDTVTVGYYTSDGTARAGSDYTAITDGTLTFSAGTTEQQITVGTIDDSDYEGSETFRVRLRNPDKAVLDDDDGQGTIDEDDPPPAVSIDDDVTVDEGDTARFQVKLSATSIVPVRVHYATMDDPASAVAGSDYTAVTGTLTFQPGQDSKTVDVRTREDTADEPTETFTLELSDPEDATLGSKSTATGTITDHDDPPQVTIGDAPAVTEGGSALFPVTLSPASGKTVTVMYRTVDGTAEASSDYMATSGELEFEPGTTRLTIAVPTTDDESYEGANESFTVELHDPTDATLKQDADTGQGTIRDNDDPIHLSIADAEAVTEGGTAVFTVTLSEESTENVTVDYATRNGTAIADSDYSPVSDTLTFTTGDTEKTISVAVLDDTVGEDLESFTVQLSSASGATIRDGSGSVTIIDDDAGGTPSLRIGDATATENDGTIDFTVTLSIAAPGEITVAYGTLDGTALAGLDYTTTPGTLTFSTGDRTKTISVPLLNDTVREATEHFTVELSSPSGAVLADSTGRGTIDDDDTSGQRGLSIRDPAPVREGGTALFRVRLSTQSSQEVTVNYRTVDETAEAGTDYAANQGTLRFPPGTIEQAIVVQTLDDGAREPTETFTVELSGESGATLERGTATGTILDNDGDGGGDGDGNGDGGDSGDGDGDGDGDGGEETASLPRLTIADAPAVGEGDTARFVVTLSPPSQQAVTVAFGTADGTARAGSDYTATSGTLRFEPGDTARTLDVPVLDDETLEDTETFSMELSGPVGATLGDGTGSATITDDDEGKLPALSIGDAAPVTEGVAARFPVTLSAAVAEVVTVSYATADSTAVDGSDYTASDGTLTFQPGTTLLTIEVATLTDDTEEPDEAFSVNLSDPAGATLENDTATGTIRDVASLGGNLPALSVADAAPAAEGGTAAFVVTLSPAADHVVTASYATADGTARADLDYTSTAGTLRFEPGDATLAIRVPVLEDDTLEDTEDFSVTLSKPAGATLADATGRGTITDDDEGKLPALSIDDAATVTEGETALFAVRLSAAVDRTVTVAFATADGTAVAGSDYVAAEGTLTFPPGTRRTVEVVTLQDEIVESEEGFAVTLSNPFGAGLEDDTGAGTIADDDFMEGLPTLSIADAAPVSEGGAAGFVVTLSPASEQTVRVSYRSVDGTAVAELDYVATEGTLSFEPGESTRTIAVTTLADELQEGVEQFMVELSNPVAATIADGTGVGTITQLAERIETINRTVLPELGRALAFSAVTCRFDRALSGPMVHDGSRGSAGHLSLSHALTADRLTSDPPVRPMREPLTLERALADSSFLMPVQDEENGTGRFAAWGCGDYRRLGGGGDGAVAWDGEAFTVNVGADVRLGDNTLAGLSVSRSRGSFDYRTGGRSGEGDSGAYDLRLTGVHPYLGWSVSPDVDVWGTVGHAWGELGIVDDLAAGPLTSAATLDSGAVGVRGRLLARGTTSVNLKGEAALARLGLAGDGAMIEAMAVNMRRLRLSTEAARELIFSSGSSLTPWGELGLRHDGGDGETGAGLEIGGGLRYRSLGGWTTEGYGRWLAAHEGALREWGFGAVVRYDPGAPGRGPSLSLMPGWGDTASGVQRLWERGATDPTVPRAPGSRLDAQVGYGFAAVRGRGVLTPFGTLSLDREHGRGYRIGSRLAVGRSANLSLEAERCERAAAAPVYAVFLRGAVRF